LPALLSPPVAQAEGPGDNKVQLTFDLRGFVGPVNDLAFSPDGKFLAACGEKVVRIYEVRTGRLLKTLRGQVESGAFGDCLAVAFSPDNCFFVVGISNTTKHGSLRVYDTDNFHELHELVPGHELPVTQLAFSHDGRYLVTADSKGELQVFDWPQRKIVGRTPPMDAKRPGYLALQFPVDDLFMLASEVGGASVVSIPSGRRLGPDARISPRIIRWVDALASVQYPEAGKLDAYDVRLDHDVWLAAGRGKANYWVGCWHGAALKPGFVYRAHTQPITALALDPDSNLVDSADLLGEIHQWPDDTGKTNFDLTGVGQPI
jgi:WD40 repeat protein